jgi:hypothetical protein
MKIIKGLLISLILITPAIAQVSSEQMLQLAEYINANVDPKVAQEVRTLNKCSSIAKFFNNELSNNLLEQAFGRLLISSNVDKKIAENYLIAYSLLFTNLLVEKKYVDQSNPESSHTIKSTKTLYKEMCSAI